MIDKEVEFNETEILHETAFKKISELFNKIDMEDWPSPPIPSPEADVTIEAIVKLRQQRILSGGTSLLTFFEKNNKGQTERREM
ncbi:MAG: hypothetical protein KKD90_04845 [Candidatus Omnitrophica bacterium]|nr:hypothetical protein [Candidatus Omnitrophota bacterium]